MQVLAAIDKDLYDVLPIYLTKDIKKKEKSGLTLRLNLLKANEFVPFHFVKPHFNEC